MNATCARIFAESPNERIAFGLHATSVQNKLDVIARVEPRIEIIWENLGGFPYNTTSAYDPEASTALCAELFWSTAEPYETNRDRVLRRLSR